MDYRGEFTKSNCC